MDHRRTGNAGRARDASFRARLADEWPDHRPAGRGHVFPAGQLDGRNRPWPPGQSHAQGSDRWLRAAAVRDLRDCAQHVTTCERRPEVTVGGAQYQVVLHDQSSDPKIVGRYGGALATQLRVQLRVVVRGLLVRQQYRHPWTRQKTLQVGRVGGHPVSVAAHEVGVRIGVQRDIHFRASLSIRSKSATARSNAGSSSQDPIR